MVPNAQLRTLDGQRHDLLSRTAKANVFIFFRPRQEHSTGTLKQMALCEQEFAGKPVHWVAIVSDSWPAEEVRATVRESGAQMPVLVDEGDALYGKLGVRLHPVIGIVDGAHRLVAYEPFREINYCDRVRAKLRFVLGEITAADVEKAEHPEKATTRTDEGVAHRHLNYARNLVRIGKLDRALDEAQRSLGVMPTAGAYALQGRILAAQGRCVDAARAFDAALKLKPGNAEALEAKKTCTK
jgi:hypothetical protein